MAGASENPLFLEDAISGLCTKIGVGDVSIPVAMMKGMKGDVDSLRHLAVTCCAINEANIVDSQYIQLACIDAFKYIANTSKYGWSEGFAPLTVLQHELFGTSGGDDVLEIAKEGMVNEGNDGEEGGGGGRAGRRGGLYGIPKMEGGAEFDYSLCSMIDDKCFQIVSVMHVGRNVMTRIKDVLKKVTMEFNGGKGLSAEDIQMLEHMTSLWNRSSAVFTTAIDGNSIINQIDECFRKKNLFQTPGGSVGLFFGKSSGGRVRHMNRAHLRASTGGRAT
jgi:hypothetical protein